MLKIWKYPVGQLCANSYLIVDEDLGKALILDPGDDADFLAEKLLRERLTPVLILATHGHFDHIMAVRELQLAFKIPFFLHQEDRFLVESLGKRAQYYLGLDPGPLPQISGYLENGQVIKLGKASFKIIHTPGHTPGSICLYCQREDLLFVGDLLFSDGGIGRTDFSYSDQNKLIESISKVLKYPGKTRLFTGHGGDSTINWELKYHSRD